MKRTLVISDIHGELALFEELLQTVGYNPNQDQLILLGDYIDRGPDSKRVLEKVMELKDGGAVVLKGNHEDMMERAFGTDDERTWKNWINRNGGTETLKSYGFEESDFKIEDEELFVKPTIHSSKLEEHIRFIQSLDTYLEWEDTIFVHAGVHPEKTLEETDPYELIWIRDIFHNGYCGERTVIFGHTPTKNLHKDKQSCSIYFGENRIIGIDGAAVYGGQLNCLQLPGNIMYSVKAKDKKLEKGEKNEKQTV